VVFAGQYPGSFYTASRGAKKMSDINTGLTSAMKRVSRRKAKLFRQAVARRRIQEMREEELLRSWLIEVWDESPSSIKLNPIRNLH
jgi:CelD/BcsL family acetyltransferase involved in cellulose biosynthesis